MDVKWAGYDGLVTRTEIETAIGLIMKTEPAGIFQNNILANGKFGMSLQSAGLVYETTGDRRALELALQLAEK